MIEQEAEIVHYCAAVLLNHQCKSQRGRETTQERGRGMIIGWPLTFLSSHGDGVKASLPPQKPPKLNSLHHVIPGAAQMGVGLPS